MEILEQDQLAKYNEIMAKNIKKAMEYDHIIHGFMIYRCEHCKSIYVMWLEQGLEDPTDDQKTGKHKPVPFGIRCPLCGGEVYHIPDRRGMSGLGKNHRSYRKYVAQQNKVIYQNFFWNDPESEHGVPIIFEPDYYGARVRYLTQCIVNIYVNTLPNDERASLFDPRDVIIEELPGIEENPVEAFLEGKINREQRRYGVYGKNGYKRPRKNKKLYEY